MSEAQEIIQEMRVQVTIFGFLMIFLAWRVTNVLREIRDELKKLTGRSR